MLAFLKSCLFFTLICFVTLYHFILLFIERCISLLKLEKDKDKRSHLRAAKWARSLFFLTPGWSIRIINRDFIPQQDVSLVIVANHESAADVLSLNYLHMQFRWLAKKELFRTPLIGKAMKWAGYISIERGVKESHIRALEECKKTIERKIPVLFFPEGTRSTLGHPKAFKIGAFKLAKEMNVPILPIVLKGAGKLLEKGSLAPSRATIVIKLLDLTECQADESVQDFTTRVEELIRDEHKKITL